MTWSDWVDLELDDEDQFDQPTPIPMVKPAYPFGTQLAFTEVILDKCGLSHNCEVGHILDFHAFAEVTSVSKNKMADGKDHVRVELQIVRIKVEGEDSESGGAT